MPVDVFLYSAKINLGSEAYRLFPTLAWFNNSDYFLEFLALGGVFVSILLIMGVLTVPVLIILWMFYLSLVVAGQVFMSFQWDALLLETGFLAIFFAPGGFAPRLSSGLQPSSIVLWLFRFLLFRLMFSSGIGKLMSGDPTWRDFSALGYHYLTQPLPTPVAWYVYHLPAWFHRLSAGGMFFIEIIIPLFFFAPRRLRFLAGGITIFLQVIIMITGNYTFFNLLTVALCVLLFDDTFLQRFFPKNLSGFTGKRQLQLEDQSSLSYKKLGVGILAVIFISLGGIQLGRVITGYQNLPKILQNVVRLTSPLRIVNTYGLFTVMTVSRPEIVVEGSNDGKKWFEYGFKYKPGDLNKSPGWVAPHQPRLDWQMWFAALGNYRYSPWFKNFMVRLLQGSAEVKQLLEKDPFPDEPPRFLRASIYEYEYTDPDTRRSTDNIWKREFEGLYMPVISRTVR